MVVVLLAQTGGFSTRLPFLILENHELVDIDWEEEAASMQGTDRPGPALSARTFGQCSQLAQQRMVSIDDRRSIIDIKNKLFYLDGELIHFVALDEEREDNQHKLAEMTFHTMSLARSQFTDHFDLRFRISLA